MEPIVRNNTTTTPKFKDYFGEIGDKYRKYRQTYPDEIYQLILENTDSKKDLAIDVGCGNGQNTVKLAEYYTNVIGFEPAEGQINNAIPHERVEYIKCQAEKIRLPPGCVDLITVSSAVHWFDLPVFFDLTKKLLRPNGSLILWVYGAYQIKNNDKAREIQKNFYENTLGEYWPEKIQYIVGGYKDIVPPYENTIRVTKTFTKKLSIEQYTETYRTMSGYTSYLKSNTDIIPDIKQQIMNAYNTTDDKTIIEFTYDVYIIISRKNEDEI
eukprot:gene800-995_t